MTVQVRIKSGCNGMGACVRMVPDVFRIDQKTGKAVVREGNLEPYRDRLLKVRDQCPFVSVQVGSEQKDETFEKVTVAAIVALTSDVVELRLNCSRYPFTPGQYAFVQMHDEKGEFFRSYSVVSTDNNQVVFCVKILPTGRGGKVLRTLKAGDTVGLGRAMGMFALTSYARPKLFITGGTGIAPVIPMCRAAPLAQKTVIFGVRSESDLFWLDELRSIPGTTLIPVLDTPLENWSGAKGRVTDVMSTLPVNNFAEFYVCGNPKMILAVRDQLLARGINNNCIFSDSFDTSVLPTTDPVIQEVAKPAAEKVDEPTGIDWQMLTRRLHFYASLALAGIILFYAATGFIANRVNLFVDEGEAGIVTPKACVPASVAMSEDGICAYLASTLPATAHITKFTQTDETCTATFTIPKTDTHPETDITTTVHCADRSLTSLTQQSLPSDITMDADALTSYLTTQMSGDPDIKHREDDEKSMSLDFGSVWGVHSVTVDKEKRQWQISTTRPAFAVAVIDLHRGKHAGFLQKIMVDITAFLLGFVTLSGIAMGLSSAARTRRLTAAVLIGGSLLLLLGLLISR